MRCVVELYLNSKNGIPLPVVGSHIRSKPRAQYLFASAQAPPLILRTKLAQDRHGSSTNRAAPGGIVEEDVVKEVATEVATEVVPHDAPLHLIICGRSDGEMGRGRRLGLPAGRDRRSTKWSAIILEKTS
jgi:hypothetical protein